MTSGNLGAVTAPRLLDTINALISVEQSNYSNIIQALFGINADGTPNSNYTDVITWNPGTNSIYLGSSELGKNYSVLPNNWTYLASAPGASNANAPLAYVGTVNGTTGRFAAFGGNAFYSSHNAGMDKFLVNTVSWLTKRSDLTGLKVVVAQSYPNRETVTRNWFYKQIPNATINGGTSQKPSALAACDNSNLSNCLISGADLLVIGAGSASTTTSSTPMMDVITSAQSNGIPVLYVHDGYVLSNFSAQVLNYFHLSSVNSQGNYFRVYGLNNFTSSLIPTSIPQLNTVQTLISRVSTGNFTSNWSGCILVIGKTDCSGDTTYVSEFDAPAKMIQTRIRNFETNLTPLFSSSGYTLDKLLILLADAYRKDIFYDSKLNRISNPTVFYQNLFSDWTSYSLRPYNTLAKNLGNFSNLFPSNIKTISQTVTITLPTSGTKDYSTGLYVIPGSTVTLLRTDGGSGNVRYGINILRDTSRPLERYDRPSVLGSPRPLLTQNNVVTLNSPFGGPLLLFADASPGSPDVTVQVTGVTTHPILRDASNPAAIATFKEDINNTLTNWVVFVTDALTLHIILPHYKTAVSLYGDDLTAFASDIWVYMIKSTYELAGFNDSAGKLTLAPTVLSYCSAKGWDCKGTQHLRDTMQHVVNDNYSWCGGGCSGNPYDETWTFDPLGWGQSHEIGHGLQKDRLKIYAGQSAEVSNNIFPIYKLITYSKKTGKPVVAVNSHTGSASMVFEILKKGLNPSSPANYTYNTIWSDPGYATNNDERVTFFRQLVEYARYYNPAFVDGWELFTLLYLLDRNFAIASANWSSLASSYVFSTYSTFPSSITGNDFMLIATSLLIGRDMSPVFDMWGITYTPEAKTQAGINGNNQPASMLFFPMRLLNQYGAGVGAPVVMTPTAVYPAGY